MWHQTLLKTIREVWAGFTPKEVKRPSDWAVAERHISAMTAEMSGQWSWAMFPHMRGIIDAFLEPGVRGIRCMKSSQCGWSETLATLLGYIIAVMAAPVIVLFPKETKAKLFNLTRFEPMVRESPALRALVPLTSREKGVTQTFKLFPGGWLRFAHSHSADEVKSDSARYCMVEEPDECESDVRGQGSTVKLLLERMKQYFDTFSVIGGSPTLSDLSIIEEEMKLTDKRKWFAACHHDGCGGLVPLDGEAWPLVKWLENESQNHPVYGKFDPETAFMVCPHCGATWTDADRARNSREAEKHGGGWKATAPFTGFAGFYISDLMSSADGAALPRLVEKYLQAKAREAAGDITGMIEFTNNQLGQVFKYASPAPKEEELEARSEDYAELTVPFPGLVVTIGVDVQPDRFYVLVVAWGRGEESWRIFWHELHGNVVDKSDPVWTELEQLIFRPFRHASGAELYAECISIDSSDGNTSDAVYWFCRKHKHRNVLAIKGSTNDAAEIFRVPHPIDPGRQTKASRYGLQVYQVGVSKAKDLIIGYGQHGGRLRLSGTDAKGTVITGSGAGRMHWYRGIRGDYFGQVTSEIKAPLKGKPRNKIYWQVKSGTRHNHALDCENYALHASRKIKVNLWTEAQWMAREEELRQPQLLAAAPQETPREPAAPEAPQPATTAAAEQAAKPKVANPLLAQLGASAGQGGGMNKPATPY